MLYLHLISVFLKNVLDYEKTGVTIQTLKRHKLNPSNPKHCTVFCSKINLPVASYYVQIKSVNRNFERDFSFNRLKSKTRHRPRNRDS